MFISERWHHFGIRRTKSPNWCCTPRSLHLKTKGNDDDEKDEEDDAARRRRRPTDIEPVPGGEKLTMRKMGKIHLTPETAAVLGASLIAYCRYEVRLPDGTMPSFAIGLSDPTGGSAGSLAMRHMGAQAFGFVSVLGVPGGDPEPFQWAYRGDGGIGFLVKPNSVDADIEAISFEMLKTFFADIADVAPDLALLSITGIGQPVPVEILVRARADLPRNHERDEPTIH
jgi:hypothetical protein